MTTDAGTGTSEIVDPVGEAVPATPVVVEPSAAADGDAPLPPTADGGPAAPAAPAAPGGPGAGGPDGSPAVPSRKPRKVFLLVGVVLAIGLAIGLFTSVGTSNSPGSGPPQVGQAAPTFSLPRVGGTGHGTVGVDADGGGNGRPAVVLFLASWCEPCQAEIPAMAAAYKAQQKAGGALSKIGFVGVDVADPAQSGEKFLKASGVTFPVGADHSYAVTQGQYKLDAGIPDAVFITADGKLAGIHYGALTAAQLAADEKKLLEAK